MSSVVASYHLPVSVKQFIDENAKKKHLSKGKFFMFLIEDYQKTKRENAHLKAYFDMATDREFLYKQIKESEEDFAAECAHNPDFS